MENDTLKEKLKHTTDALADAVKEIEKVRADEADRIRADLIERGGFKVEDLATKSNEDLRLMQVTLDRAGVTNKSAGIKKSTVDGRELKTGLTVGGYKDGKWYGDD
jgi:hypothetical protein